MAVTDRQHHQIATLLTGFIIALTLLAQTSFSAVLPEDRADVLYHSYEGGGVKIDGPSILLRKQFKDQVSVWGNYYVDNISGASIDVQTSGSAYTERRVETTLGVDYLRNRSTMSLSVTNSDENDYKAKTVSFSVSQDFFGDLTTLSLKYSQGDDDIMRNNDPDFFREAQHQRFGLNLSQILTKNLIVAFTAESVIDEGYLNNPYRKVRYIASGGIGSQEESYPTTRNSDAFAFRSMYYLPYRAALRFEYRRFSDSWGIKANNYEFRYTHPYNEKWLFEGKFRAYSQNQANFYSDLFPRISAQNFLARDKELSIYSNKSIGFGIEYQIGENFLPSIEKKSINFYYDRIIFDYENFRENTAENTAAYGLGNEPLYKIEADVIRLFFSVWF